MGTARADIALLGCAGVGKTCLILTFMHGEFTKAYHPTVEDFHFKDIPLGAETLTMNLSDTGGYPEYAFERETAIKHCSGFLIVYDVTNRKSYEAVPQIRQLILELKQLQKEIPIVLVGNKADKEDCREVDADQGQELASTFRCPFFEASALTGESVEDVFLTLVMEMQRTNTWRVEIRKSSSNCCVIL